MTPTRISWLDSTGAASSIHLTWDGKDTLCGRHEEYLARRYLVKSPNKRHGRSMYCRSCFMGSPVRYPHSLPWHPKCSDPDSSAPPPWSAAHSGYMKKKYPKGFVKEGA
jgi:hypothetical protein